MSFYLIIMSFLSHINDLQWEWFLIKHQHDNVTFADEQKLYIMS